MRRLRGATTKSSVTAQSTGYATLKLVERPFLSSIQQPNFRSTEVNTDHVGFRMQYDRGGVRLDLATIATQYDTCDVLLGGSVAFGIGVSSDTATLAAQLADPGVPCVNLGIRGATSQQELAAFLALESSLPKVRRVILLTGVNECILAAHPVAEVFDVFGGGFLSQARSARHTDLERPLDEEIASDRLELLLKRAAGNLRTWGRLRRAFGLDLTVVIQPVAGWTRKQLSRAERSALSEERRHIQSAEWVSGTPRYQAVAGALRSAAADNEIACVDSNPWFDHAPSDQTFFTDVCHLTDQGTGYLAGRLREYWCL
ncbi:SGNH/GDSL hydrolase family protein [Amycolatopsis sp. NPDC049868]|uniref:SGNH/GDSL hydrolase family protein n=1 Tax=Amycolatopsis sp. NPDC049868 TaxID=3363934 RepID=UPI0037B06348